MRKKKNSSEQLSEKLLPIPSEKPQEEPSRRLESYSDYLLLMKETINDVRDKKVDHKTANTVAVLTGYAINILRELRSRGPVMSAYLQNMRSLQIKIDQLPPEEVDRFLQGSEDVQMEILQRLDQQGIIDVQAVAVPKHQVYPKLDTKQIGKMAGVNPEDVRAALAGEAVESTPDSGHSWTDALGGKTRFCVNCGTENQEAKYCSGEWGLE